MWLYDVQIWVTTRGLDNVSLIAMGKRAKPYFPQINDEVVAQQLTY